MTLGHLAFVQITSTEETVAMETVVSDAGGTAEQTGVEERTEQNILRIHTQFKTPNIRKAFTDFPLKVRRFDY